MSQVSVNLRVLILFQIITINLSIIYQIQIYFNFRPVIKLIISTCRCVAVGTVGGYRLHSINSTDSMDLVHRDEEPEVYIAERLFSSSLVAVVSTSNPRTLRVCHFKKGTEICRYSYNDKIRAVRMNRSRLVVCLEESLYIHNIRDMKVIHIITSTPPNPSGLIALSADTSNFCFLASPGHSHTGQLQVR